MSLAALLLEHPFADDEPLLHTIDRTVTAGEARASARAVAASLADAGVRPGHAVAVQMPNGIDAVTAMFGTWLAGAVFVPLNPRAPGSGGGPRHRGHRHRGPDQHGWCRAALR